MRFLVVERVRPLVTSSDKSEFANHAANDLKYKLNLERRKKIVAGGPFLDILADAYILETETLEELGEILFNAPSNLDVDREVHPLGTFADSLEGMNELKKGGRPA